MSDFVIFGFGVLVTIMSASAILMLLYAAYEDRNPPP